MSLLRSGRSWLAPLLRRRKSSTPSRDATRKEQFSAEVLPAELEYVQGRREAVFGPGSEQPQDLPERADRQLLGLAFSGGGIRSATFNLGVLQALERHGVFKFVDYLSTVSGGGFLGCALSALLSQKARESAAAPSAEEFPLKFEATEEELPAVSYLRNNANYLAPRGPLDYLRIFAVLVRGIILNFLAILPLLLIATLAVTLLYGQPLLQKLQRDDSLAELTDLLERNWVGVDAEKPVRKLVETLELRGMLDVQRGVKPEYVVEWLQGDERRGGGSGQEALPPLILGIGAADDGPTESEFVFRQDVALEEVAERLSSAASLRDLVEPRESGKPAEAEFVFRKNVTLEDVAERLWSAGILRDLVELREIDAVEQAVRTSNDWLPGSKRPRPPDCETRPPLGVASLYLNLSRIGPAAGSGVAPPLLDRARGDAEFMLAALTAVPNLVEEKPEGFCLEDRAKLPDDWEEELTNWHAAGDPPNLRRILQELYSRGFYNPEWLARNRTPSPTGRIAPKLRYLETYELAVIEDGLREAVAAPLESESEEPGAETSRPAGPTLNKLLTSPLLRSDPEIAGNAAGPKAKPSAAIRRLLREVDPEWDAVAWRGFVRALWDEGLIAEEVLRRRLRESYGRSYELVYSAQTADRGWLHPYEHPFQITLWVVLAGLGWVLLYPVLVLVGRTKLVERFTYRVGAPLWRDGYERSFSFALIVLAATAFLELQPFLLYHYRHLRGEQIWWPLGIAAVSLLISMIAGPGIAYFRGVGKTVMLALAALAGPVLPLIFYLELVLMVIYREELWAGYYVLDATRLALTFIAAAAVIHLLNLPTDANSTSLHGFYRDRLGAAYLMRIRRDRRSRDSEEKPHDVIVPLRDVSLEELCVAGSGAPYHLVNATLNLQGAKDPSLRRRRGDFFQFSKYFVGSKQTGYCGTKELKRVFPHVYVSSAMAVSAAAAAPNMGTYTAGPLVVLMALLNIRLGYWLPNPRRVNRWLKGSGPPGRLRLLAASLLGSFGARPGAYQLLLEMLGRMRSDARLINLSDGGHMENTGVYELLRRRCRFIIVGDAEADPDMHFGGLAALIRYARIDLGIEIDIQLDDLRLGDDGESRQHCALGVIHYPESDDNATEVGYLLYIKASVTGDESEVVTEYHNKSPEFPHESTADQSFEEGQFEAYRDLGYHICQGLFDGLSKSHIETFEECAEWFDTLSISLSPGLSGQVAFSDIQSALGDIRHLLREPGYRNYFYEIYPELSPDDETSPDDEEPDPEAFRNIFHLVTIQMQLMESLFIKSELAQKANRRHPANRGWMNLFRRWARAPSFRRAYLASITTFSAPFQQFCQTALGLALRLEWRPVSASKRAELAGRSDEIGLPSLEDPLPDGAETLILTASLKGTAPVLIAECVLEPDDRGAAVRSLHLRSGYQGSGMRARAMLALKEWTRAKKLELSSDSALVVTRTEDLEVRENEREE